MGYAHSPDCSPVRTQRWELGLLAVCAVLLTWFRLHAFSLPLETDECNYAYIAGGLLDGDRLYVDVWDHQPPGVFMLFAAAIAVFGDAPAVFRMLALAFSLGSLVLVWGLARRLGGPLAACVAAILFAVSSSDPGTAGEGCNREIFMNTLLLAAWYAASWGIRPSRAAAGIVGVFLAGILLGLASLLKTNVAVFWVILAFVITWAHRGAGWLEVASRLGAFAFGPFATWTLTAAYFLVTRRWHEFYDAVIVFNLGYSEVEAGLLKRFALFFRPPRHPFVLQSALPLWIAGGIAAIAIAIRAARRQDPQLLSIVLMLVGGFVAVCLPGKFWPHYYYLLLPTACIASGVGIAQLATTWPANSSLFATASRLGFVVVVPALLFGFQLRHYLLQPPFGITVKRYNSRDFWGRAQGENVGRVTNSEDSVFVFGNDAAIYYYSKRRCASRYTMITGLHSGYPGFEARRKILLEELARRRPRVILVLFDEDPWEEWVAFLKANYTEPVGWDFDDKKQGSGQPKAIMFVVARKDRPIESIDWNWDRSAVGGWNP